MTIARINSRLFDYLDSSPSPYHAVLKAKSLLLDHNFIELKEAECWQLCEGQKYFITRQDSSIVAFVLGKKPMLENGIRLMGTHTDSPCLKVKPNPITRNLGYLQLGVETYGGVLLNPWFDRDLSLAGKVICLSNTGELVVRYIDFERAVAIIPSLAIHLDRSANDKRSINPQEDIRPILLQAKDNGSISELVKQQLKRQGQWDGLVEVVEHDLRFYDTQKAGYVGLEKDFICSSRLDNLLSSYVALQALIDAGEQHTSLLVMNDHEEVGSVSNVGAQSNFLDSVLARVAGDTESRHRILARSLMFSLDNAHGIHPNFASRHDDNHGPLINSGPVLKFDANQSYATSGESAACVKYLADKTQVPLQSYVTKTGLRCGSTIGPMSSAQLGIRTVDLGLATFAMHSIRETGGAKDPYYLYLLLQGFLESDGLIPNCS